MKKVAIVGSGVSACACAAALKEKGINFTLFEKETVPGGKICTEYLDDFVIEAGPDSFLPEKYWTLDLIRKIGLSGELLPTNEQFKGTYIYSGGRLHPLPEGVMLMVPTMIMPLLTSTLISLPGKIRMALELFVPRISEETDESLAQFVTRRLGRECLEKIAEPLVAGIHTSDPDNMSVKAIFPRFLDMEKKHGSLIRGMVQAMKSAPTPGEGKRMTYFMSLRGGMQTLIEGTLAFVGREKIRTGAAVQEIIPAGSGYCVVLEKERLFFDSVVLSTPSYVSMDLIRPMDQELGALLSAIEWSSTATISLAFKQEDIHVRLPGFGFIVPRIEKRRINATTWTSVKWSHRAPSGFLLLRTFVGGGHHQELVSYGDEDLIRVVREELADIAGITGQPLFSKIYRWVKSMPKYTVGHLDRVAAIEAARRRHPGLCLIGCSYRGIGIGDCVKSGFDAAAEIAANMS